jgi:hypothetical protein
VLNVGRVLQYPLEIHDILEESKKINRFLFTKKKLDIALFVHSNKKASSKALEILLDGLYLKTICNT